MIMVRGVPVLLAVLLVGALACGGDPTATSSPTAGRTDTPSGLLRVAATVSPITSVVENIGGTRIRLEGIVPEGANSHTFEPAPSVARVLADADLIVLNGLSLEEPTLEMAEANKKPGTVVLLLGDRSISREDWQFDFSFPESKSRPNPHLWPDPLLALRYAELVKDELVSLDPSNAEYYNENFNAFQARITELDRGITAAVQTIPIDNRRLLTYHDSWAYFARRYGMTVIGAAQPSDFSKPSAQEVARLIDQVKDFNLPSVFGSDVFPSDVLETIARESGAKFIDRLRDDDLPGSPGDPRHSYLGLMLQNMETMIPALGGSVEALAQFDPSQVFEGDSQAVYPQ